MKTLMKVLIVIWFLCIAAPLVFAGDITLTYSKPTSGEITTPASLTSPIASYRIWELVATVNDPDQLSVTLPKKKPGEYQYYATSIDEAGAESRMSGVATKTVTEWVTTSIVVSIVAKVNGDFLLLGVGTTPLGTPCNLDVSVNGRYAVPFDNIVWSDPARNDGTAELPLLVVAECG